MHIRIATRQSELALWQAEHVADILKRHDDVKNVELVPLSTRGDEILDRSLQKIGGKGLFIKELEVAMQEGRADIAVHSMKDVPVDMPDGFCIAAVLPRASAADALVGKTLEELPRAPASAAPVCGVRTTKTAASRPEHRSHCAATSIRALRNS